METSASSAAAVEGGVRPSGADAHSLIPYFGIRRKTPPAVAPDGLRCEAPFYRLLESSTSLGLHLETPPPHT